MTHDEELPRFRPRMGRRQRPKQERLSLRRYLLSKVPSTSRLGGGRARANIAVRPGRRDSRRVLVKAHFVRMTAQGGGAQAAHLRYIQRDGIDAEASPSVLYGPEGPVRPETAHEVRPGEKHQFRVIVSPEDSRDLDLTDFVQRLMAQAGRDLGRNLEWVAINHYNTQQPHTHVVVRGIDKQGREVSFEPAYISNGLRWRAQEIATEELGPRPELELRRALEREVGQERFTSLDRDLERRADDHRLELRRPSSHHASMLLARVRHLESMGLADQIAPAEWVLRAGWQRTLRELAMRGDIIKQMHAAVAGDPQRYQIVARGQQLPDGYGGVAQNAVVGRVAAKGLSDELKGTFYAVIETPTGVAYHVPLDARTADRVRVGDLVALETKPEPAVRPIDRCITDLAGRAGGLVRPEHVGSEDDARRAEQRLRALERLGLVTPAAQGVWRIPPDLPDRLEHQQETPTRQRLWVTPLRLSLDAQARYLGPVWLDRVDEQSIAPYGFGAKVRQALDRREAILRERGIAPEASDRHAQLLEIERQAVARTVSQRHGWSLSPLAAAEFRGRVSFIRAPEGRRYTVLSDGSRFVLLPAEASHVQLEGREVVLSRTPTGRLVMQPSRDRGLQ